MRRWTVTGSNPNLIYVEHPTNETLFGKEAMIPYLQKEETEQGAVRVRMGKPIVDGDHVVAEFWATGTTATEEATLIGCFIAQLDPADGLCTHFRQYWLDVEGHRDLPGLGRVIRLARSSEEVVLSASAPHKRLF